MPTIRITEEQVADLVSGETVNFTQEQLLHLFKFASLNVTFSLTKTSPGNFDVFSFRRQSGDPTAPNPSREENISFFEKSVHDSEGLS